MIGEDGKKEETGAARRSLFPLAKTFSQRPWRRLVEMDRRTGNGPRSWMPPLLERLGAQNRELKGRPAEKPADWLLARARAFEAIEERDIKAIEALRRLHGPEFAARLPVGGKAPFFMALDIRWAEGALALAVDTDPWNCDHGGGPSAIRTAIERMDPELVGALAKNATKFSGRQMSECLGAFMETLTPGRGAANINDAEAERVFDTLLSLMAGLAEEDPKRCPFRKAFSNIETLHGWPKRQELSKSLARQVALAAPLDACREFAKRASSAGDLSGRKSLGATAIARVEAFDLRAAMAGGSRSAGDTQAVCSVDTASVAGVANAVEDRTAGGLQARSAEEASLARPTRKTARL
jgi:hypothetical protein